MAIHELNLNLREMDTNAIKEIMNALNSTKSLEETIQVLFGYVESFNANNWPTEDLNIPSSGSSSPMRCF